MPRPFSRLPEPLAFIRHFTPSWFAVTMGTGVLALVIAHLPWHLPGLSMLAEGLWFVAVGLFALFSLLFLLRLAPVSYTHLLLQTIYGNKKLHSCNSR